MKTKKLIVSTYNWDIEWLKMTYDYGFSPDNTVIYDKSDGTKVVYDVNQKDCLTYEKDDTKMDLSHLGEVIPSRNVGAGTYDMLEFIIQNYDDLPDINIFIKGNLLYNKDVDNYYTTEERFIEALQADRFFSIWQDKNLLEGDIRHLKSTPRSVLEDGRLIQPVSHIFDGRMQYRYFSQLPDLLCWCFVNPPMIQNIEFVPASNFVVPKENILKYSKTLYERLQSIISYEPEWYAPWSKNVCGETYILERLFYFMWNTDLQEAEEIADVVGTRFGR